MWILSKEKEFERIKASFSWVKDMESVPQDAFHHAEGNVAIHTQMVLQALLKLPEYQVLDSQEKEILWAASLMHDIEKRSTTLIDAQGRISSPGHAKKGANTTRGILYRSIPTPFVLREAVVGLVRHHGLPLWIFDKPNPQKSLLQASFEINTYWVYLLAKADVLGRICQDQAEMLYRLELFKEFCLENNCWAMSKKFASCLAKFSYFQKDNQSPDYVPFDDTKGEVILLSGIAGAGKDRYYQAGCEEWPMISLDAIRRANGVEHGDTTGNGRVIQQAKEQAKKYLRSQTPFVWNATNLTRQMREPLIALFASYGARVKIIYVEVPYRTLHQQNQNRNFPIPSQSIERMIDKWEVPQPWEAHEVDYVI